MKRYCKNANILDFEFLEFCAGECLRKKWKRRDVLGFFSDITGRSKDEILYAIRNGEKPALIVIAARHMQKQLAKKELHFMPIWYKEKIDASNHKLRRIGIQHVSQQLYDYVAVYAMQDLMKRIGEYQCASIAGRGPYYGLKHVRKWLKARDAKYVAQLDVQKCFPSIPQDKLLAFIDKYVANADVRWLVRELVNTFDVGLSIGSYLSQYLCNLYMSQLYHEISERMYYTRRGKPIRLVKHVLFYMDDILLIGCNAKAMHKAVDAIIAFAKDKMGLTIKPTWNVRKISKTDFVDTMGFRVYGNHVTIRQRVFLRVRRAYKKPTKKRCRKMTEKQAQKCVSYFGCIKGTNLLRFAKKFHIFTTIKQAKGVVAHESKLRCRAARRPVCA